MRWSPSPSIPRIREPFMRAPGTCRGRRPTAAPTGTTSKQGLIDDSDVFSIIIDPTGPQRGLHQRLFRDLPQRYRRRALSQDPGHSDDCAQDAGPDARSNQPQHGLCGHHRRSVQDPRRRAHLETDDRPGRDHQRRLCGPQEPAACDCWRPTAAGCWRATTRRRLSRPPTPAFRSARWPACWSMRKPRKPSWPGWSTTRPTAACSFPMTTAPPGASRATGSRDGMSSTCRKSTERTHPGRDQRRHLPLGRYQLAAGRKDRQE